MAAALEPGESSAVVGQVAVGAPETPDALLGLHLSRIGTGCSRQTEFDDTNRLGNDAGKTLPQCRLLQRRTMPDRPDDAVFVRPATMCSRLGDLHELLQTDTGNNTFYVEYADLADALPELLDIVEEPAWARAESERMAQAQHQHQGTRWRNNRLLNFWLGDGRAREAAL